MKKARWGQLGLLKDECDCLNVCVTMILLMLIPKPAIISIGAIVERSSLVKSKSNYQVHGPEIFRSILLLFIRFRCYKCSRFSFSQNVAGINGHRNSYLITWIVLQRSKSVTWVSFILNAGIKIAKRLTIYRDWRISGHKAAFTIEVVQWLAFYVIGVDCKSEAVTITD